ncbi:PAAR domain-containing protein [Paraburkholderia sp. IMGN_8]|uniref:PAAR domain-containing protein n=1 Tax=Paraburkholderia sp. IMGN_8 TaxID=3136564 RepID=UPI0031017F18
MKSPIRKGDKLELGGEVTGTCSPWTIFMGRPLARKGDEAVCDLHGPTFIVDSGASYVTAFRPKVVSEIDGDPPRIALTLAEKNAEKELIKRVAKGINGALNGIDDRIKYTVMVRKVLL